MRRVEWNKRRPRFFRGDTRSRPNPVSPCASAQRAHTHASAEVVRFAPTACMVEPPSTPSREALQKLFVRASVRRAERQRFVETLRTILEQRLLAQPLLLLRIERRLVTRET